MTKEDQLAQWKKRPYSWSQHSSFRDYDKEEWYQSYIKGNKKPGNKRMDFGSAVGKRIETDPKYIPQLPREGILEYPVEVMMGDTALVGYMDAYCSDKKIINEFKTSNSTGWNQQKVDQHGQLHFYALLLMLKEEAKPEELTIRLHHLVTEESGDFSIRFASPFTINTYITKRTTRDCLLLGAEIIKQRKLMKEYILNHE